MASKKYGVRPPGWAKHRRNLDQPFEPKLRKTSKKLIREAEEDMKTTHAAKDSEVLATSRGREQRAWCGEMVPAMRCVSEPHTHERVNCWDCQRALRAADKLKQGE